jgi:hypothetical protein
VVLLSRLSLERGAMQTILNQQQSSTVCCSRHRHRDVGHRSCRSERHTGERRGTSLCEVLVALVLLSATAAWGLQAAAAAESALGAARVRQTQLHRAEWALAELDALPCDSINIARTIVEPRWRLTVERDHDALSYRDDVLLQSARGDTVRLHRGGWCD